MYDDVLFENSFCFDKDDDFNEYNMKRILNILLNSKELSNGLLMSLRVKALRDNTFILSGVYYVKEDNKSFTGSLTFKDNECILFLEITKYNSESSSYDLGEIFNFEGNTIKRFSSYPGLRASIHYIDIKNFDKYTSFKESTIKSLKRGNFDE